MKNVFFFVACFFIISSLKATTSGPEEVIKYESLINEPVVPIDLFEDEQYCIIISVQCGCGTWQFQYCTGTIPQHPNPVDTANKICCEFCGEGCIEVDPGGEGGCEPNCG